MIIFSSIGEFSFATKAANITSGNYEYSLNNSEATITKYIGSEKDVVISSKLDGYNVVAIDSNAFRDTPITNITIPSSVKEIGFRAFQNTKLKSINFPESLTYLGFSVFENCKNLKDIYYAGSKESWSKINISSSSNDELYKAKIHYGKIFVKPSKVTKATKKFSAKKLAVKIAKVPASSKYRIQVSTSKKFKKNIIDVTSKKTSLKFSSSKLKKKKTLYARVQNSQVYNGKTLYSK